MIETSEADIFFDKIYELATDKISKTKGMDVIVILGGTGSGKSTLISMIAGC
jgi:ABC-type sugar transport system ATPase subunit